MAEPLVVGNLVGIISVIVGIFALLVKLGQYHSENQSRLAVLESRMDELWRLIRRRPWRRGDQNDDEYDG